MDFDGQYSYSETLSIYIQYTEIQLIRYFSIKSNFYLLVNSPTEKVIQIELINLSGEYSRVKDFRIEKGESEIQFDIENLHSGIYILDCILT